MATITPFLWFDGDLAEPIAFYTSIFPDSNRPSLHPTGGSDPISQATIELCGQTLMMFHAGSPPAPFSEAVSLFVAVESQEEVDRLWDSLTSGGGAPGRCGWLKDRFGLSWQIVPTLLGTLLGSTDRIRAQQALDAMMKMDKLDLAALQAAYDA